MEALAAVTPRGYGLAQLSRLCHVVGLSDDDVAQARALFDVLAQTWSERPLGQGPDWPSDITGDHTPYEFSLAFDGPLTELRFLAEAHAHPMNMQSAWQASLAATERFATLLDVPLDRLRRISDLFVPTSSDSRFALWHAVCLRPGTQPELKVYLNPNAQGTANARANLGEALERLGLTKAWQFLVRGVLRPEDALAYLSLDLSHARDARIKVYTVHPGIEAEGVERLLATDIEAIPGAATEFCRRILGSDPPYASRPLGTCFAFTSAKSERPYSTTLHIPMAGYFANDAEALPGLRHHLDAAGCDVLDAAIEAMSRRDLASGRGIFQWVSMRWRGGRGRMTVYTCPETYSAFTS
jgi:DMATS type aromatic prenyltransferase